MATRNRNIGYTGQPYREDPERDVLWARPEDPPGGNVTTERQWQDRSIKSEDELEQSGKAIDKDNSKPSYADYPKRDDSSPSGYTVVTGGGVKGSKNKADKARSQGYGVGMDGNAGASGEGTSSTPVRTGGSILTKATEKVGDAIDDSKREIDRALTNARYEDIAKRMDETYGRNKTRLEEEEKRARRNRLMYGIGDVFNAMHRAYAHSRGIQAMPGSERQMSDKARERYDKIVARREKLDEDYANFLLKLQNARTMSDRYAALDEWRRGKNKIDKQNADTKTAAQENRTNQNQQVTDSVVGRNEAQAGLANAKKEAVERNGTASGNPPKQSGGSKGGGKGRSGSSKPNKYGYTTVRKYDPTTHTTTTSYIPNNGGGKQNGGGAGNHNAPPSRRNINNAPPSRQKK